MSASAPMQFLYESGGRKWYFANPGDFTRPGVWFWDGERNVHIDDALAESVSGAAPEPEDNWPNEAARQMGYGGAPQAAIGATPEPVAQLTRLNGVRYVEWLPYDGHLEDGALLYAGPASIGVPSDSPSGDLTESDSGAVQRPADGGRE